MPVLAKYRPGFFMLQAGNADGWTIFIARTVSALLPLAVADQITVLTALFLVKGKNFHKITRIRSYCAKNAQYNP
ncbi:MAG: hypothetical protein ACRCZU_11155, partial [Selenomonadaceae bacterium]